MIANVPSPRRSAPLIGALTVIALAAIAYAVPRAALTPEVTKASRGLLVSHSRFSDQLAEQVNADGYNFLAIELTDAPMGEGAIWASQFDRVNRIFPVWGWVDVRKGTRAAEAISVPLKGLFLYGATPRQLQDLKKKAPGLKLLPVVRDGWTGGGEHAVALAPADFTARAKDAKFPVLMAAGLDMPGVRAARRATDGNYLVATIVLD